MSAMEIDVQLPKQHGAAVARQRQLGRHPHMIGDGPAGDGGRRSATQPRNDTQAVRNIVDGLRLDPHHFRCGLVDPDRSRELLRRASLTGGRAGVRFGCKGNHDRGNPVVRGAAFQLELQCVDHVLTVLAGKRAERRGAALIGGQLRP